MKKLIKSTLRRAMPFVPIGLKRAIKNLAPDYVVRIFAGRVGGQGTAHNSIQAHSWQKLLNARLASDEVQAQKIWVRMKSSSTKLKEPADIGILSMFWAGRLFGDFEPYHQLASYYVTTTSLDSIADLNRIASALTTVGIAHIEPYEKWLLGLENINANLLQKTAICLLDSKDADISTAALARLKALTNDSLKQKSALNRLVTYSSQLETITEHEMLSARRADATDHPWHKFMHMRLLLSREKMIQANVVAQSITVTRKKLDTPFGSDISRFFELMETYETKKVNYAGRIKELDGIVGRLSNSILSMSDEHFRMIMAELHYIKRYVDALHRCYRVQIQSGVALNPGHNGYIDTKQASDEFQLVRRLPEAIIKESSKRQLHDRSIKSLLMHQNNQPPVLNLLIRNGDIGIFLERFDYLAKIHGEAEWLDRYQKIATSLRRSQDAPDDLRLKMVSLVSFIDSGGAEIVQSYKSAAINGDVLTNAPGVKGPLNFTSARLHFDVFKSSASIIDQDFLQIGDTLLTPSSFFTSRYPRTSASQLYATPEEVVYTVDMVQRTVNEPVVILHHNDPAYTRNYYHQLLLVAGRIIWLSEHGHLKSRKLVMPESTPSYIYEFLDLLGIQSSHMITVNEGERVSFEDAYIMPSIEIISAEMLKLIRKRAWKAAGISADTKPTKKLLILRRGMSSRRCFQEPLLIQLASKLGFEEVRPEQLSILEQIRMFADAKSVVGLAGASFTNLVFSRDGIPVVGISKNAIFSPTFVEMALALNQKWRWLVGPNIKHENYFGPISTSYFLEQSDIEEALSWTEEQTV